MSDKSLIPRERAGRDVDEAVTHYINEHTVQAALGFVDSLENAYAHIGRYPGTGSSRFAHELDLPELRTWPLTRFPYLVFYVERKDHVDVWRVLHTRRDIPALMQEPAG